MPRTTRAKSATAVATAISANDFLAQIRASIACQPEEVPKGYLTCAQWAKEWNLSRDYANAILRQGVSAGTVKLLRLRVITGRGLYPTPHYGPA
jgi:hypothetical protein